MDQHTKIAIATIGASTVTALATIAVGYLGFIKPSDKQLATSPVVIQLQQTNIDQIKVIENLQTRQSELVKENETLHQEVAKRKLAPELAQGPAPEGSNVAVKFERVKRETSLNEAVTFDSDVTASVSSYSATNGPTVWVNGKNNGYQSVGARFEAKRDGSKVCFVELMSVSAGEGAAANAKPKFGIDYFCTLAR